MHCVYVLKSDSVKTYVGRTSNIKRRIAEHRQQKVWTTKRMGIVELVYFEAFKVNSDAIRRERYLKTNKGKKGLKLILRDTFK